jgi:nitroreductase
MKLRFSFLSFVTLLVFLLSFPAWADVKLPSPRTDHRMTLFEALKQRASAPGGDFPTAPLSDGELSDVLWATTGLNRGAQGWTVPMAEGLPPYVDVYVAQGSGVFLYDWKGNALKEISKEDIRAKIGSQRFVASAPCSLILVGNARSLSSFKDKNTQKEFAHVAAGAMTQDTYLAASALGLGARYIHSMKTDEIKRALRLPAEDFVICLMILGK